MGGNVVRVARQAVPFLANVGAEAVSASTAYCLVDLSDSTNFPHTATNEIHLLGLHLSAEKASDGAYDVWVGVVTEADATDGSAQWVHVWHLESTANATDSTDRFNGSVDFTLGGAIPDGLNLRIASSAALYLVGNQTQASNGNWQTDTGLASPVGAAAGATGKPGAGDLVAWVEEVSGEGTIDFSLTAQYETA